MEQRNNTEMNTEMNNNVQTHPLFRLMMQSINMIPAQDGMMNPQGLPGDILQRTFEEQQDITESDITGDDLAKELGESLADLFGKN